MSLVVSGSCVTSFGRRWPKVGHRGWSCLCFRFHKKETHFFLPAASLTTEPRVIEHSKVMVEKDCTGTEVHCHEKYGVSHGPQGTTMKCCYLGIPELRRKDHEVKVSLGIHRKIQKTRNRKEKGEEGGEVEEGGEKGYLLIFASGFSVIYTGWPQMHDPPASAFRESGITGPVSLHPAAVTFLSTQKNNYSVTCEKCEHLNFSIRI